jgi:putative photosynthetic complex assembly protein
MNATVRGQGLPSGVLVGAALLVGFALIAASASRLLHWHAATNVLVEPVKVLHLRFADRSDGAVEVRDADRDDRLIHVVPAASNGFLRGVLRALTRARISEHVGHEPPFTLTRWADGQLTIADPQTGQRVSLEVFGPSNYGPFAQLLTDADDKELPP